MTKTNDVPDEVLNFVTQFQSKYGVGYTTAVSTIMPFIPRGCSWGIISKSQARELRFLPYIDGHKPAPEGITFYPLKKGYLVFAEYNDLIARINDVAGTPVISPEVLANSTRLIEEHAQAYYDLLAKGYSEIRMGFFSLNDKKTVTINGESIPSFNIDYETLLAGLEYYNYNAVINGRIIPPAVLRSAPDKTLPSLELAPSTNAVMIRLVKDH